MANLRTFVSKETYNKAPVELYGTANLRAMRARKTYHIFNMEGTANLRAMRARKTYQLISYRDFMERQTCEPCNFYSAFLADFLYRNLKSRYKFFTNSKIRFSRSTVFFPIGPPWKLLFARIASSIGTNFKTNPNSFSPSSRLCVPISFSVSHK